MRHEWIVLSLVALSSPAAANDWEKYYTSLGGTTGLIPSRFDPEIVRSTGDIERDMEMMFRRGYEAIGYTSFETGNAQTKDAFKLARRLTARYMILDIKLSSTDTMSLPFHRPTTSTSYSSGTVSGYGSSGRVTGTYSGTTTTHGSETTYVPFTVNRFSKFALFFMEIPKRGLGLSLRDLTNEQMAAVETRRAAAVKWVRDGSPGYKADIFPGDIILAVNGEPYDYDALIAATRQDQPFVITVFRNGQRRDISLTVPEDWRPR